METIEAQDLCPWFQHPIGNPSSSGPLPSNIERPRLGLVLENELLQGQDDINEVAVYGRADEKCHHARSAHECA